LTNVQSKTTTRAEPEDHLWSADHSLRSADLDQSLGLIFKFWGPFHRNVPVLSAWSLLKLSFRWMITTAGFLKMKPPNFSTQFFLHLCLTFM